MGIDTEESDDIILKVDDGSDDGAKVTGSTLSSRVRADTNIITEDKDHLYNDKAYALNIEYSLNNSQTVYHSFQTPNTSTRIHLRWKHHSIFRTAILFYEAPSGVVYNFSWTPKPRDRVGATASASTVQAVTSQTSAGTFLYKTSSYGADNHGQVNESCEWILAQNTEYFLGMQSFAASNLTMLELLWYEI